MKLRYLSCCVHHKYNIRNFISGCLFGMRLNFLVTYFLLFYLYFMKVKEEMGPPPMKPGQESSNVHVKGDEIKLVVSIN